MRDTHGCWPYLAAAAALPVSAAAVRRPELRPLAALLLHQSEEWFWPGGFLPWINRELMRSDEDEFPIDRRAGLAINVGLGWSTSLAVAAGPRGTAPVALLYVTHVANIGMHVGWAVRKRRYDPGLVTAVLTLAPTVAFGFRKLLHDPAVSRRSIGVGLALGISTSAAFPVAMRRRMV